MECLSEVLWWEYVTGLYVIVPDYDNSTYTLNTSAPTPFAHTHIPYLPYTFLYIFIWSFLFLFLRFLFIVLVHTRCSCLFPFLSPFPPYSPPILLGPFFFLFFFISLKAFRWASG